MAMPVGDKIYELRAEFMLRLEVLPFNYPGNYLSIGDNSERQIVISSERT